MREALFTSVGWSKSDVPSVRPSERRSSGSYPNSGFSDSVSGFCKLFLKLKKSNGFSDSRILLHFLKAYYLVGFSDSAYFILNGFSDSVSGFSDSTDSRILCTDSELNGFSDSQKHLRILRSVCGFSDSQRILACGFSELLLKLDFSCIYVIIYLKTQITLVLEGFRTNPEKCELFEFIPS